jgi:hypothetical protein
MGLEGLSHFCQAKIYQDTFFQIRIVEEVTAKEGQHQAMETRKTESIRRLDVPVEDIVLMNGLQRSQE